jgi:hypothetical protein
MTLQSATKIDKFSECERLGAFHYWGKALGFDKEPKGLAASLGIELHAAAQAYLEHGHKPDHLTVGGAMFLQGLPYLPPPKTGGVEGEKLLEVSGISYGLFLDLFANFDLALHPPPRRGRMYVGDHKTSSNPTAYGLWQKRTTGEGYAERHGFLDNVQAVLYAAWYLAHTGDSEADLLWLYYGYKQTKFKDKLSGQVIASQGPPFTAKPSYITLSRGEIEDAFGTIVHPQAQRVVELEATQPHPLSLDYNPRRCHKYGRDCHYVPVCNLKPTQKLFHVQTKKKEPNPMAELSVSDRLAALAAKKKAEATGAKAQAEAPLIAASKPDLINPPEAASKQTEIEFKQQSANGAGNVNSSREHAVLAIETYSAGTPKGKHMAAIFARRIGEALIAAAKELEA